MSKSRIKVKLPTIATLDEAEAVMNELALTANNLRFFIAGRDAQVLKVNESFAPEISTCEMVVNEKTDILRAWAEASPDQFPKGSKSLALAAGTLGFRTGTPKLALLSRAWNWEKVLAKLKSLRMFPNFVRTKEEVDKEAIISTHGTKFNAEIANFGVKVVQDESFYIEPNLTDTDARQSVGAKS